MRRTLEVLVCAAGLTALSSCSTGSRMSVGGPGSLELLPPSQQSSAHHPSFTMLDSVSRPAQSWVLVSGDSMLVLTRPEVGHRLSSNAVTPVYHLRRVSHRLAITGYSTADGRWHEWWGAVRAVNDSLEFLSASGHPSRLQNAAPPETLRIARATVKSLRVEGDDPIRTVVTTSLAIAVFSGLLIGAALLSVAASVHN